MDRAPGLSVRLKLTLSYAGFLMLAGALLLADMAHIAGDVRVRQSLLQGAWAGRPVPTSPRDDQVGAGASAEQEVGDREQHRPRREK